MLEHRSHYFTGEWFVPIVQCQPDIFQQQLHILQQQSVIVQRQWILHSDKMESTGELVFNALQSASIVLKSAQIRGTVLICIVGREIPSTDAADWIFCQDTCSFKGCPGSCWESSFITFGHHLEILSISTTTPLRLLLQWFWIRHFGCRSMLNH